jgi:F420H(2)-dependent quinone reductase
MGTRPPLGQAGPSAFHADGAARDRVAILWPGCDRGAIMPSDPAPRVTDHRAAVLTGGMPVDGEYEPSTRAWVREQVELYENSGGTRGTTLRDTGLPVVIITNRGARSGNLRKTPVMRVEHDGRYAAVASQGGAPTHPFWYYNLRADPLVELQDGPRKQDMAAREVTGDERAQWWERAVAAYPPYAEYQERTARQIPVFVLEPRGGG